MVSPGSKHHGPVLPQSCQCRPFANRRSSATRCFPATAGSLESLDLAAGLQKTREKSPFLMGKLNSSTGPCSIAMLVYQRVSGWIGLAEGRKYTVDGFNFWGFTEDLDWGIPGILEVNCQLRGEIGAGNIEDPAVSSVPFCVLRQGLTNSPEAPNIHPRFVTPFTQERLANEDWPSELHPYISPRVLFTSHQKSSQFRSDEKIRCPNLYTGSTSIRKHMYLGTWGCIPANKWSINL